MPTELNMWLYNIIQDLYEEGGRDGTYAQFQGYPGPQDDAGYLCPSQPWNSTWQSFHHHQTSLSQGAFTPGTAMTSLMTEDEAPPAYTPSHNTLSGPQWLPCSTSSSAPNSRDYAEIMTFPMRPPPISPPLPPISIASHAPYCLEQPLMAPSLPLHRDFVPQCTTASTTGLISVKNSTQFSRLNQSNSYPPVSDYCSKLQVSSAI